MIIIIFAYTQEISFVLRNYLNKDHWYSIKQSNLSKQDINCQRFEHFYHWLLSLGYFEHAGAILNTVMEKSGAILNTLILSI